MSDGISEALGGTYFNKYKYTYKGQRITPKKISTLKNNEIFVFGSNIAGRHGLGAAKQATKWGAIYGKGIGLQGKTYAIPTKDKNIKTLSIEEIKHYVDDFIDFAFKHTDYTFLVTQIGCGYAGYKPKDIAPLFSEAKFILNIHLPKEFWTFIE